MQQAPAPRGMSDLWKIAFGFVVVAASVAVGWWLLMKDVDNDVHNYEQGSSAGNTVWRVGLVGVVALGYVLYLVFRDVEEVVEHELHEHREELQHLESFEPRLFHVVLAVAVLVVAAGFAL